VANVFHLLSQPMTALQCSLEFALMTLDNPVQCRGWVEAALENSERLRCRLSLARQVAEVASPDDPASQAELRSVLAEALSEADGLVEQPAAAAPQLHCQEIEVSGERSRLLRAFFYLLQNLRVADQAAPHSAEIRVECESELVEVRFLRFVLRENLSRDQLASQLEIAKESFESAGGGLIFFSFAGNDALLRVFLRKPLAQLDLYNQPPAKTPPIRSIGTPAVFPQVS
jgi:hypothetical protein